VTDVKFDSVSLEVQNRQIKTYSGGGKCEPITTGLCAPAALAAAGFPSGNNASSICNGESTGIPNLASGVDQCRDGESFSFGLFQINIIAHQNEIKDGSGNLICKDIFDVNGGGTQGACMPGKSRNGICFQRDCQVKDQAKYQSCKNYITNPVNNITFAKNLFIARDWEQWGAYNSCRNSFPRK
jgi:hypothetical protein